MPSTQDGHAHRTDGDRQQASQPCTGTGQQRRVDDGGRPDVIRRRRRQPETGLVTRSLDAAPSGALARTTAVGSSTTTASSSSGRRSTRPVTFTASDGSIRSTSEFASPVRTIGPVAVPSSSVKPSDRRSTTSPPTRTVRPRADSRSTRSASSAFVDDCARRRRGALRLTSAWAGARAGLSGGSDAGLPDIGSRTRQDRGALVRCARVGGPDDPGDVGDASLRERSVRDPSTRLPEDDEHLRADGDLCAPTFAELVNALDAARDGDEPPDVGST